MNKLVGFLLAAGAMGLAAWAMRQNEEPVNAPETPLPESRETQATVLGNRRSFNAGAATFSNGLLFEAADGEHLAFTVPGECFRRLNVGDTGILTWVPAQEDSPAYFVSFLRDGDEEMMMALI